MWQLGRSICLPWGQAVFASAFLMRLLMGVWESWNCPLSFEIKGLRCAFPTFMMKLLLGPQQDRWEVMWGPLHIWPPEEEGLPVGWPPACGSLCGLPPHL